MRCPDSHAALLRLAPAYFSEAHPLDFGGFSYAEELECFLLQLRLPRPASELPGGAEGAGDSMGVGGDSMGVGGDSAGGDDGASAAGKGKRSREEKQAKAARKRAKLERKKAEAAARAEDGKSSAEVKQKLVKESKRAKKGPRKDAGGS